MTRYCLALAAALAVVGLPALAQGPGEASAPWLGDETYSIHTAGMLQDVIQDLHKLTGVFISPPGRMVDPYQWEPVGMDLPVVLDHDNATLRDILLDICEQTGMVFESPESSTYVSLRPGDLHLDSRPRAELDDYTLAVTRATISRRRWFEFHWGEERPEVPQCEDSLTLQMEIMAKSDQARLVLAGLGRRWVMYFDEGDPVTSGPGQAPDILYTDGSSLDVRGVQASVQLPPPPTGATMITRLEGALRLYSEANVVEANVKPDQVGQTLQADDMPIKVQAWGRAGNSLRIVLSAEWPQTTAQGQYSRLRVHSASLHATDTRTFRPSVQSAAFSPEAYDLNLTFVLPRDPPVTADYLALKLVRTGNPDQSVPFVIQNIPIP